MLCNLPEDVIAAVGEYLPRVLPNIITTILYSSLNTILLLVARWRIYEKAGQPGWAALIPVYDVIVLCRIIWGSGTYIWFYLIPIYNIFFMIWSVFRLARVFDHGGGFGLGLLCFPTLFELILAFDRSSYRGVPFRY